MSSGSGNRIEDISLPWLCLLEGKKRDGNHCVCAVGFRDFGKPDNRLQISASDVGAG